MMNYNKLKNVLTIPRRDIIWIYNIYIMESGYPCEYYLTLQIGSVDGLHVTPDTMYDDKSSVDYSDLTLDQIIWLQQQDQNGDVIGDEGRYCPRGLESYGAQPNGITPCPLLDRLECGRLYSEYASCPTDRRRQADDLSQYGDTNDWEY